MLTTNEKACFRGNIWVRRGRNSIEHPPQKKNHLPIARTCNHLLVSLIKLESKTKPKQPPPQQQHPQAKHFLVWFQRKNRARSKSSTNQHHYHNNNNNNNNQNNRHNFKERTEQEVKASPGYTTFKCQEYDDPRHQPKLREVWDYSKAMLPHTLV